MDEGGRGLAAGSGASAIRCKRSGASKQAASVPCSPCASVPGQWLLQRPGCEQAAVTLTRTRKGAIKGTGRDTEGSFRLNGLEKEGVLEAQLDYIEGAFAPDVAALDGTWEVRDAAAPHWAFVEAGRAHAGGVEVGSFCVGLGGRSLWYIERGTSRRQLALARGTDLLCWESGTVWRRVKLEEEEDSKMSASLESGEGVDFDPPRESSAPSDDSEDVCNIMRLEVALDGGALAIAFEASWVGPSPDLMKSQLRIDGRVVKADRAKYDAVVAKSKRVRSKASGRIFFEGVTLRPGSGLSLRYGGEFTGWSWAELVPQAHALVRLVPGLCSLDNPLRRQYYSGRVLDEGRRIEGDVCQGPVVSLSGKTARAIKSNRDGRLITFSLKPYDDKDMATIIVRGPAVIRFTLFKTEATYDVMTIGGDEYSGNELPPPRFVPEGRQLVMVWKTDDATIDEGWEFTVQSGLLHMSLSGRDAEFGALEAPWNQADAVSSFKAPLVLVEGNDLDPSKIAGRVVVFRLNNLPKTPVLSPRQDQDGAYNPAESGLMSYYASDMPEMSESPQDADEVDFFGGRMLTAIHRAAAASASAVVIVATQRAPLAGHLLATGSAYDGASALPRIPAVVVGSELGDELIAALQAGAAVAASESATQHFSLCLQAPAPLEPSRGLVQCCLQHDNVLRAMLDAELAQLSFAGRRTFATVAVSQGAAGGNTADGASARSATVSVDALISAELRDPTAFRTLVAALCARVCSRMGSPLLEERALNEVLALGTASGASSEVAGAQAFAIDAARLALNACIRVLLRQLVPSVTLLADAVLPPACLDVKDNKGEGEEGKGEGEENKGEGDESKREVDHVAQTSPDIWERYHKDRVLGAGVFGSVRQGWDRLAGGWVAVKELSLEEESKVNKNDALREIQLLRDSPHPNVMRIFDVRVVEKKLFIVTELAVGGDLCRHIKSKEKTKEPWVAAVVRQVLAAGRFLQKLRIVHHDIKPANVLVTGHHLPAPEADVPCVVLADFGLARRQDFVVDEAQQSKGAGNGTPAYMPPESAKGLSGPKSDSYSVGITLYELLSGGEKPEPIDDDDGEQALVDWQLLAHCSADAVMATKGLMAAEVSERLSCMSALALSWFWASAPSQPHGADKNTIIAEVPPLLAASTARNVLRRQVAERLRGRAGENFLRRALANLLVGQLGRLELEDAKVAFAAADADADGILSDLDLVATFQELEAPEGLDEREAMARGALLAADVHGRGWLCFRQFAAAYVKLEELHPDANRGAAERVFAQLAGASAASDAGAGACGSEIAFHTLAARLGGTDAADVGTLTELLRRQDPKGHGRLTRDAFFSLLGLDVSSDWSPPLPPEPLPGVVKLLRGSSDDSWVDGRNVEAIEKTSFLTFGQPSLARSSGRWYYEVEVTKADYPQVGWADMDFEHFCETTENGVGDDNHSWGVDGVRQMKWQKDLEDGEWDVVWARPVIVGCAVNLDPGSGPSMLFAADGEWAPEPIFESIRFTKALYPAASGLQIGAFRFGESECIHRPPDPSYAYLVLGEDGGCSGLEQIPALPQTAAKPGIS